jgi:hypothetical protein
MQKVSCPKCAQPLQYRRPSKRDSEHLWECKYHGKFQTRAANGRHGSPYQVAWKGKVVGVKSVHKNARISEEANAAILAVHGSFQNFIDFYTAVVVQSQQKT